MISDDFVVKCVQDGRVPTMKEKFIPAALIRIITIYYVIYFIIIVDLHTCKKIYIIL